MTAASPVVNNEIFRPFATHVGPLGGPTKEAKLVAWAMTEGAYLMRDEESERLATDVATALKSKRDSVLAGRIRGYLTENVGKDVSVAEIEQLFRFKWREVDIAGPGGQVRRSDPYYSQYISSSIFNSFRTLLFSLPSRLAALPGLVITEDPQLNPHMHPRVNHACNVLLNRLSPYLCGAKGGVTHQDLLEEARKCLCELSHEHTEAERRNVNTQEAALRVLHRLCVSALAKKPIADILFHNNELLHFLATRPPHQLLAELQRARVPFAELSDFLTCGERIGVRGAAKLPPNGATRELSIQRWAMQHGNAVIACVPAVFKTLQALSTMGDLEHVWHGVIVTDCSSPVVATALQTGGRSAATPCLSVEHVFACDNLSFVATAAFEPVALLIPRLARVVFELVSQGHLSIKRIRADLLMPIVRRWDSEAEIERERIVQGITQAGHSAAYANQLSQIEDEEFVDLPASDADALEEEEDATQLLALTHQPMETDRMEVSSAAAGVAMEPRPTAISAGDVPLSLERDHAIVICTRDLLLETTAANIPALVLLPVKTVTARVVSRAYDSLRANERSTLQSVGCVFTKLCAQAIDGVSYFKTDSSWPHDALMPKPKGASLVLTPAGCANFHLALNKMIYEMRNNGSAFAKKWFPSRSSRSHSRRSLWQRRNRESEEAGGSVAAE